VVAGDVTGDFGWYAAGRWTRLGLDSRWGRYLKITPERLQPLEKHFERHSARTLFLGKLTQGVGFLTLLGAGAARIRPERLVEYSLLGTLPKSLAFLLFGFYFGRAFQRAGTVLEYAGLAAVAAVVILTVTYLIPRRFSKQFQ